MSTIEDILLTENIDHHGIIAAVCKDLKIAEKIDDLIGKYDPRRKVSTGTSVVAMIINGLGFTNRRLYLTHQFFKDKPVELLLKEGLSYQDITDDTLGKALTEIGKYGATKLFGEVTHSIVIENHLLDTINHLDTTSISVEGEYEDEDVNKIHITYGHSKDKRPDLKQFVLSMVMNGPASLPIWLETLDGNSSDNKSFHNTIAEVRGFQKNLCLDNSMRWIADSKLYVKDKLLSGNHYLWVTRVPETIKEAKELTQKDNDSIPWEEYGNGYKYSLFNSDYGGLKQRWLLVHSEQSRAKEMKTFVEKIEKLEEGLKNRMNIFSNKIFNCKEDAMNELLLINKKERFFEIEGMIVAIEKYEKTGRPKKGEEKKLVGFSVECVIKRKKNEIKKEENSKGKFILATNDLDQDGYPNNRILKDYKDQHQEERGFRFLKDPWFMLDSVFLKDESRITALMMVMTLCLFVYNFSQHKIRDILNKNNETLPNQLNKEVQNPTLRWLFQLMEGISVVKFIDPISRNVLKEVVTNLDKVRLKIIRLLGDAACKIYKVSPV